MNRKHAVRIILSLVLCLTFIFCLNVVESPAVAAEETSTTPAPDETEEPGATGEPSAEPSLEPTTEPTSSPVVTQAPTPTPIQIDVTKVRMNKKKNTIMAKKKTTLSLIGLPSSLVPVVWKSTNTKAATVSTRGVVKGVKKGTAVIEAYVGNAVFRCNIKVVSQMVKKDFSKFSGENFVSFCQRKGYNHGYAWLGQWKGGSKKKSTYRKIKIGASTAKVKSKYGEFTLKKCSKKDPFTKIKGLKKNKVKKYTDMKYGKYRIRFYFNKKNKVVAIIYSCNLKRIKKRALKKYI